VLVAGMNVNSCEVSDMIAALAAATRPLGPAPLAYPDVYLARLVPAV
jgi:hypothetical protein